jgi:hypothetical protein
MNAFLRQSFGTLLIAASCHGPLFAMPLNKTYNASAATPACGVTTNFWLEDFTLPDGTAWDDGATWDNKGTIWTVYNGSPKGTFAVSNNEFKMNNLTINGASYWQSDCISIAGKLDIRVSVDVRSAGDLDNDATDHGDYLRLYYKLDGGSEVLFAENLGKINNNSTVNTTLSTAALGGLNGSTIQIVIRGKATAKDEWYYFDNVKVTYQVPVDIQPTASVTQQITCSSSMAVLSGGSAITGASYSWTGPNGFSTAVQNPTVSGPGDYVVTVTDPASGCTSTATATVTQVLTQPASVNAIATNQLTCAQHSAMLTGSSGTTGVSYEWTGPNGFSSTLQQVSTTVAGSYTLTVTHPTTGCTSSKTINLLQNITAPNASIAPPDMLTCDATSVTLTGSSATAGVRYAWSGPDDFSDVAAVTTATEPGDYQLTVINPVNGCSSIAFVTVEQDITECEAVMRKAAMSGELRAMSESSGGAITGLVYSVYPNPAGPRASIDLGLPESGRIAVVLYSSAGVREKVLFEGQVEAHRMYKFGLDASGLTPGVHFCVISQGGKMYTRRIMVL